MATSTGGHIGPYFGGDIGPSQSDPESAASSPGEIEVVAGLKKLLRKKQQQEDTL
jgi:hypothetical protein